jgi:hypothetical protein
VILCSPKKKSTKEKCLKQAYVRNPHKQYVGGLTMTALRGPMADKGIGIKIIIQFEEFPEIFGTGRDSADILYLVQCEVHRMRKSYHTQAPIRTIKHLFLPGVAEKRQPNHHGIGFPSIAFFTTQRQKYFLTMSLVMIG